MTGHYLLAGLAAGLAASTKYNAGMIVVAIAAAHLARHGGSIEALRPGPLARLGLAALASLAGFVLGTPYALLDFETFRGGFLGQLELGQVAWSGQAAAPTAWLLLAGVAQGAGLVVAVLAALGGALLLARERRQAAVLLSFPLCYLAFMAAMELFFVRWVVPAMPFVALLAARGLESVLQRGPLPFPPALTPTLSQRERELPPFPPGWRKGPGDGGRPRGMAPLNLAGAVLIVLALLQPALFSLRLDWLAQQRDTRQEANVWAERNIPPGSRVAVEAFSLLDQESLAFRATLQRLEVELVWRATQHDLDYYRQDRFDYLAVSSFMYDRAFAQPDKYADRVEFYRRLDREHSLQAVFHPRADGTPAPFDLDDTDTPFWHLFSYDRPGPTIKVYRLGG